MDNQEMLEEARANYSKTLVKANDECWKSGASQVDIGLGVLIAASTYQVALLEVIADRLRELVPSKD